jgi:hypothetical protein
VKPPPDVYDSIKPLPPPGSWFMHFPGVYCQGCGETFALYSFSAIGHDGVDENGKPFLAACCHCRPGCWDQKFREIALNVQPLLPPD